MYILLTDTTRLDQHVYRLIILDLLNGHYVWVDIFLNGHSSPANVYLACSIVVPLNQHFLNGNFLPPRASTMLGAYGRCLDK
jgi:hypothetical protein